MMKFQGARTWRAVPVAGLAWSLAWASPAWPGTPIGVPLKAAAGVKVGTPVYNPATDTYDAKATVTNHSARKTFHGAFALVVEGGGTAPTLANPSGQTSAGKPYLLITLPATGLPPRKSVRGALIQFNNPDPTSTSNTAKFAVKYKLYGFANTKVLPIAAPTYGQTPLVGDIATLDGSASISPSGKPLNYVWTLTGLPNGSFATLANANTAQPSLVIDQPGSYQVQLLVNDGAAESNPAVLDFATGNAPPLADTGGDQTVAVGDSVYLDGSNSYDPENADLTYTWTLVSKPQGSAATLADANTAFPSFVADVAGPYQVKLVVNDGVQNSAADIATISAQ